MAPVAGPRRDAPPGGLDGDDPSALPVSQHADAIVAAVRANPIVVVIGETGSGKTTQMAQILLRASVSRTCVAVTQPRRVAAVSVARRVAREMRATPVGPPGPVGYGVRFEDRSGPSTRVKFLTDGTLLNELRRDPTLARYDVVVLDEAHERTLNADVLMALLKRIVAARARAAEAQAQAQGPQGREDRARAVRAPRPPPPPLKLVVTSATIDDVDRLAEYLGGAPVLRVPGRQHPVRCAHATEQPESYFRSAIETALDVHRSQGEGDVLVFLTGKDEVERAAAEIARRANDENETNKADDRGERRLVVEVLPLYAALPPERQALAFAPRDPSRVSRRVVVATNVAETSVTVPGISFVVDPGTEKRMEHDHSSGVDRLVVGAISQQQAKQRAGRAGRLGPGRCFRLYTKDALERDMPFAPTPEIMRANLASVALFLKTLEREEEGPGGEGRDRAGATERAVRDDEGTASDRGDALLRGCLSSIDVLDFDWFDRPDRRALESALRELYVIGAIDARGAATATGREMARVPAEPGLARAMVEARRRGCVDDVAAIAGMLGVERVYAGDARDVEKAEASVASAAEKKFGDLVPLLRVFRAWEATEPRLRGAFCERHGLSRRGMDAARDVRRHLAAAFAAGTASRDPRPRGDDGDSDPPTTKRVGSSSDDAAAAAKAAAFSDVRFCFCVGFANRLARRMPRHNGFRTLGRSSATAEVHPSSARAMADDATGLLPEWVAYGELVENAASARPFLRHVCVADPAWVAPLVTRITESPNVANLRGGGGATRPKRRIIRIGRRGRRVRRGPSILPRARGETIKRRWRTRGGGTSSESERRRRRRRRSDA